MDAAVAQVQARRAAAPDAAPIARREEPSAALDGQRAWRGNYAAWQESG